MSASDLEYAAADMRRRRDLWRAAKPRTKAGQLAAAARAAAFDEAADALDRGDFLELAADEAMRRVDASRAVA